MGFTYKYIWGRVGPRGKVVMGESFMGYDFTVFEWEMKRESNEVGLV